MRMRSRVPTSGSQEGTMTRSKRGLRRPSGVERREADQFFADFMGWEHPQRTVPEFDHGAWGSFEELFEDETFELRADRFLADLLASTRGQELGEQAPAPPACPPPSRSAKAYFFGGSRYVRYNIVTDQVDVGPAVIRRLWHFPAGFDRDFDAAVNWGNGLAYFFRGSRYVRYNIATNRVDVGPAAISRFWTHLPAEFQRDLDAAVNWGNGKTYFFKGSRYLRYDIATDHVDVGPTAIARYWPSLPPSLQQRVDAAVNWTDPCDLAALMQAAGLSVVATPGWQMRASTGQSGCFTPIGVMMHHTVGLGPGALADVIQNVKANFFVARTGELHVVSGGRTNHAGMGSGQVLHEVDRGIAPSGTAAARGLPNTTMGNGHFYGFENENRGDGVQPWPAVQIETMARGAAALCQRHGWGAERVISHAEWTNRKIDPQGIDMNDFRTRVASHF